jgi:hypothetical protein
MNNYYIVAADGQVRESKRAFLDILQVYRSEFADIPGTQVFFAPERAIDGDGYLVMEKAIGLVNSDGLIIPLSGDDYLPDLPAKVDAIGLMTGTALQTGLSEPCPACDGFGDDNPERVESTNCCRLCGGGGTLGDAVLLAMHRAARLETHNPVVGLVTSLLRGDSINVGPRRMSK